MRSYRSVWRLCFAAALVVAACSTVPLTGRKQLSLIPSSEMLAMSDQQYEQFLSENPPVKGSEDASRVQRVGTRIQKAVESYLTEKGYGDRLQGYAWEFNLVKSDDVNAWCMPGGRVVVYSGILPVTRDDTGLAVVMGHEVAHAVAEHGSERMSQQLLAQAGGLALAEAVKTKPVETQNMWLTAFGLGAQIGVLLPFSRNQESEADELGLTFMALAGYDPAAAVDFWSRMAAAKGGGAPPEFLSTHPSDDTRIANLKKLLPEARKHYNPR
jgi:predicted Zn-dependent protease